MYACRHICLHEGLLVPVLVGGGSSNIITVHKLPLRFLLTHLYFIMIMMFRERNEKHLYSGQITGLIFCLLSLIADPRTADNLDSEI